ncbi:hypothetical protein [Burkholderia stagnalis]|uniref:hypothetical protein n=1 Tax=Burkholderia stagnalis TaxID=1503054 RepID=UPI0012D85B1A|nr:hypothetical protein [Burkholderia stagnalis]
MEIAAALPDKANKPKRMLVSKSPEIFASGEATKLRKAFPSTDRAYANVLVGISVGIYCLSAPEDCFRLKDMNSVGGPRKTFRALSCKPLRRIWRKSGVAPENVRPVSALPAS